MAGMVKIVKLQSSDDQIVSLNREYLRFSNKIETQLQMLRWDSDAETQKIPIPVHHITEKHLSIIVRWWSMRPIPNRRDQLVCDFKPPRKWLPPDEKVPVKEWNFFKHMTIQEMFELHQICENYEIHNMMYYLHLCMQKIFCDGSNEHRERILMEIPMIEMLDLDDDYHENGDGGGEEEEEEEGEEEEEDGEEEGEDAEAHPVPDPQPFNGFPAPVAAPAFLQDLPPLAAIPAPPLPPPPPPPPPAPAPAVGNPQFEELRRQVAVRAREHRAAGIPQPLLPHRAGDWMNEIAEFLNNQYSSRVLAVAVLQRNIGEELMRQREEAAAADLNALREIRKREAKERGNPLEPLLQFVDLPRLPWDPHCRCDHCDDWHELWAKESLLNQQARLLKAECDPVLLLLFENHQLFDAQHFRALNARLEPIRAERRVQIATFYQLERDREENGRQAHLAEQHHQAMMQDDDNDGVELARQLQRLRRDEERMVRRLEEVRRRREEVEGRIRGQAEEGEEEEEEREEVEMEEVAEAEAPAPVPAPIPQPLPAPAPPPPPPQIATQQPEQAQQQPPVPPVPVAVPIAAAPIANPDPIELVIRDSEQLQNRYKNLILPILRQELKHVEKKFHDHYPTASFTEEQFNDFWVAVIVPMNRLFYSLRGIRDALQVRREKHGLRIQLFVLGKLTQHEFGRLLGIEEPVLSAGGSEREMELRKRQKDCALRWTKRILAYCERMHDWMTANKDFPRPKVPVTAPFLTKRYRDEYAAEYEEFVRIENELRGRGAEAPENPADRPGPSEPTPSTSAASNPTSAATESPNQRKRDVSQVSAQNQTPGTSTDGVEVKKTKTE